MNRQNLILGGATVFSFSIGGVTGYLLCHKRMGAKYDQLLAEQIKESREFYSRLYKKDEYSTPEEAYGALIDEAVVAVRQYQGKEDVVVQGKIETITEVSEADGVIEEQNIFNGTSTDQLAIDDRHPDVPYVISMEEYMENEHDHEQVTMTYYEGDNVLSDERDKHVEDVNGCVGRANLMLFGIGSGDPNVVLVRNERLRMDFEVLKSTGKYAHEVLGFDEELKHSDAGRRKSRRRWDDDE